VKTKRLAINFRDFKDGETNPRVLSEEDCSVFYIESPANDRAENGLRRSLSRFISYGTKGA
jgi:hypothetical protein